jgi:YbbR domain-containing protein
MKFHPLNKEEIKQKTKAFFHSQKWENFLVFLVFVAVVSVFWLLQNSQPEQKYDSFLPANTNDQRNITVNDSLFRKGKEVPVRINGSISPASGYRFVDSLHIEPADVWVYGDKKILDALQWIETEPVKEDKILRNLDLTLKLQVPKGLNTDIQTVRVTAEMEEFAEKKFELPVLCRNHPSNIHVRFFPSSVEIVCYISLSNYTALKAEDLEIRVDYNELIKNSSANILLMLVQKPQWLTDYRIIPESVEYLIEQKQEL